MAAPKSTADKIIIPLVSKRYPGLVIVIDPEDEKRVRSKPWRVAAGRKQFYARSGQTLLHRFILKAPAGMEVDHINGNGLDCRKANLRLVSRMENAWNQRKCDGKSTSRYKGVCRDPYNTKRPWRAYITANKRTMQLGFFASEHDAALAYDTAARKYFGEFARLNLSERF